VQKHPKFARSSSGRNGRISIIEESLHGIRRRRRILDKIEDTLAGLAGNLNDRRNQKVRGDFVKRFQVIDRLDRGAVSTDRSLFDATAALPTMAISTMTKK
jgi:hypothetical protein